MRVFDDKTSGVTANDKYYVVSGVDEKDDVIFKTSFIVASDLVCSGNVSALFDLVVFGDIDVEEMDVKGKLICLGNCKVNGQLMVQNIIWAEDIVAESVVTHDQIVAQSIDATNISADGNVIVGRTLSVEKIANIGEALLCGETVFGSGKVVANSVLTLEPIDLDEGIDAIIDPNEYVPSQNKGKMQIEDLVEIGLQRYEGYNDYEGYICYLMDKVTNDEKTVLNKWLDLLYEVDELVTKKNTQCKDGLLLIRFFQICDSLYFRNWEKLSDWKKTLENNFVDSLISTKMQYRGETCTSINVGDMLLHTKYGRGRATEIIQDRHSKYVSVKFVTGEEKKFVIPDCFKFFQKVQEVIEDNSLKHEGFTYDVGSYEEWLEVLAILEKYRKEIDERLYITLFDGLLGHLGLKSKFILDRLKTKGWS